MTPLPPFIRSKRASALPQTPAATSVFRTELITKPADKAMGQARTGFGVFNDEGDDWR